MNTMYLDGAEAVARAGQEITRAATRLEGSAATQLTAAEQIAQAAQTILQAAGQISEALAQHRLAMEAFALDVQASSRENRSKEPPYHPMTDILPEPKP